MAELRAWARSTVFCRAPTRTASRRAHTAAAMPLRVTQRCQDQQVRGGCRALWAGTGRGLAMVLVPGAADPAGPAGQGWAPLVPHGPFEAAALGEATPRMALRSCQWKWELPQSVTFSQFMLWEWLLVTMSGLLIVPCLYQGHKIYKGKLN